MARLPLPGADKGTWGEVLNDYLATSLNADGSLKANIVDASNLTAAVRTSLGKADTALQTSPNASDAQLRDRATHTGTQLATTISDFSTAADARITASNKKTDSMATNKLLGRSSAATGPIEEITLGSNLTLSAGTLNAAGGTPEKRFDIAFPGTIAVQSNFIPYVSPYITSISRITMAAGGIPQGSAIAADVKVAGNSIFAQASDRPQIAAGQSYGLKTVTYGPIAAGTAITVDITAVGSTTPGQNLVVSVFVVEV